jgi:Icc-related predicted phosphoesterase
MDGLGCGRNENTMKIWFISDTHNEHEKLRVPEADWVIHCGDESTHGNAWLNEPEARRFFEWYAELPIPSKIYVPGNHSLAVENGLIQASDYPSIRFLIHEQLEIQGLRVFGSPYTPRFHDWAYMKKRTQLDQVWQTIPEETDILVTHGPPKGVLDLTHDSESGGLVQVGCMALRRHVETRIKPRVHAFGHLHDEKGISNFGMYTRGETQFLNCSCCDLSGQLRNNGWVLEMNT